jgi:CheY-like chemotaxis protein
MTTFPLKRRVPRHDPVLALLADSDAVSRRAYVEYLRSRRWQIEEAADGREALAKAIGVRPDVVITDTSLPGISGFDLCALLRRDLTTQDLPIIALTDSDFAKVEQAKTCGADMVLVKPCLPDILLREMQEILLARSEWESAIPTASRIAQALRRPVLNERPAKRIPKASLRKAHQRHDTVTPPLPPPSLLCPGCDRPLSYQRSHIGGVSEKHSEQWDYYECVTGCGQFQFRQRTRKLRRVS